jgi:uncharacterized protein
MSTPAVTVLLALGAVVLLAGGAFIAVNFLAARFSVYPIRFPIWISPGQLGFPQERVEIATADGHRLRAWYCPGESEWALVFGHGYLMNRSEFVPLLTAVPLAARPHAIFFDFRAHGGSSGKKCTFGVEEARDVAAVYDYLRERVPGVRFVYIGSSMGAAAGALAISQDGADTEALWLDAMYGDLEEASTNWWRFVGGGRLARIFSGTIWFAQHLLKMHPREIRMDEPLAKLADRPIVLVHGGEDPLVSEKTAQRLLQLAGPKARLDVYEKSSHGRARLDEPTRYTAAFRAFLQEIGAICDSSGSGCV